MQRLLLVGALAVCGCASASHDNFDAGLVYDFTLTGGSDGNPGANDLAPAGGDLTVAPPVLSQIVVPSTEIAVGQTFTIAGRFDARNVSGPLTVAFTSSDPSIISVAATAQLTFNMQSATAMAAALTVGDATITVSQGGVSLSLVLHVVPSLSAIAPTPLKVQLGQSGTLTLTLSSAALQGGADIALQSADPTVATVPPTVTIAQGMTSADVTVTSVGIGQAAITATYASSTRTAQAMVIDPVTRLVVSEVLYDALGADDGFEWIELYNGSNAAVDLTGYFLGTTASSMNVAYTAVTPALTGMLMPGDCAVVGGPTASPMANALPANFTFEQAVKFNPNLPNGTVTTAEAVAIFQGSPQNVGGAKIVDAVIYGTAQRGISDENGMTTRLDVGYVKFPAQTIERFGQTAWRVQNTPTGGSCDWLHL